MRFKLLNKGINEEKSKLSRAQINRIMVYNDN